MEYYVEESFLLGSLIVVLLLQSIALVGSSSLYTLRESKTLEKLTNKTNRGTLDSSPRISEENHEEYPSLSKLEPQKGPKHRPPIRESAPIHTSSKAMNKKRFFPDTKEESQETSKHEKEETHIQLSTSSTSETYWVDARANGKGVNVNSPAGNITYVLHHYELTNDIVKVQPGAYTDSIENYPLTPSGSNITFKAVGEPSETILNGNGDGKAFVLTDSVYSITIEGFTITNHPYGIHVGDTNSHKICGNYISDCYWGVLVENSSDILITKNTITENEEGIELEHSRKTYIEQNAIKNNSYGVRLRRYENSQNRIEDNNIRANGLGVSISGSRNTLKNNTFKRNNQGFFVDGWKPRHFDHTIKENTVNGSPALYLYRKEDMVLTELELGKLTLAYCTNMTVKNSLVRNGDSLRLAFTNNSSILDNSLINNVRGINLRGWNNILQGNSIKDNNRAGIYIQWCAHNIVKENTLQNNLDGIVLHYTSNISVLDNVMRENKVLGLRVQGWQKSNYNHTIHNNIVDGQEIYYFFNEDNLNLKNIHTPHLTLAYCNDVVVTNSHITGGYMFLASTKDSTISENLITDNSIGILVRWKSTHNLIKNNTIRYNHKGIEVVDSIATNNIIKSNLFKNNSYGIDISWENLVYGNNFIDNNVHAVCYDFTSFNNSFIGNYWDNYNGTDTDGDGIGETPYVIPGFYGSKDYLPAMEPFNNSMDTLLPSDNNLTPIMLLTGIGIGVVVAVAAVAVYFLKTRKEE